MIEILKSYKFDHEVAWLCNRLGEVKLEILLETNFNLYLEHECGPAQSYLCILLFLKRYSVNVIEQSEMAPFQLSHIIGWFHWRLERGGWRMVMMGQGDQLTFITTGCSKKSW